MMTKNKLFRSQNDSIIAGVAAGLGDYFEVDPVLIRIIFVFLALINGLGIIFYFILIFIIPKERSGQETPPPESILEKSIEKTKIEGLSIISKIKKGGSHWFKDTRKIIGLSIILVGLIVLINRIYPIRWFKWDIFWPIALTFTGLYLIFKKEKKK